MIELKGKKALVTGGSRGIGRAIAEELSQAGCDVAINFLRNKKAAEDVAKNLKKPPLLLKGNVSNEKDVSSMFEVIQKEWGALDIVVSNAASGVLKPPMELTLHHWHWTLDINSWALLALAQKAVPLMKNGGKIIGISSLGSVRAIPNYTLVGASKAALESIVRHLAQELASKKINVNAISAGVVDTDALKHFSNRDQLISNSQQKTPAGRLVEPKDVAKVALFLCSDLSEMIHGQTIIIDGGYSIVA
ncbi:MAG: enoyl-[acyl-carrier-protein] reductase [Deltaproteobacteria bacterium GWA2_38_16]|nr:MAG: enoyl-[acyl-carrier-protein] reductase [Deltaproteobacteria bacterium GWA2_38_16]OGQ03325.1 MAG: enoyl-[acyl-carrier-protein] reductase [Deltaproteobacteria bacterium RIFCSPHIGHO2_02_FULL_38_15]